MPKVQTEPAKQPIARELLRELRWAVEEFNYEYADVLDRGEIERWPDFFTDDGIYRLIARDNADSDLPLSLMSCDGKGMLKDRAYAIAHTEMFAPRYTMHHIGQIRVTDFEDRIITAQANYIILETLIDEPRACFNRASITTGSSCKATRCCSRSDVASTTRCWCRHASCFRLEIDLGAYEDDHHSRRATAPTIQA